MDSSLREYVCEQITEYSDDVKKYFESLASVAEHATIDEANNPEHIVKHMATIDENLQRAVEHIESHQLRQQQIIQVQDEIQQHNLVLLNIILKLGSVRDELDLSLTQAKVDLKAMKYASDSNVRFTDILSYASKLSKYTSAPPNFDKMSKDMKIDFEKPYPDEEKMRRGLLYWQNALPNGLEERFESSDSEMSTTEDVGDSSANKQAEDTGGDPFWILDLNP